MPNNNTQDDKAKEAATKVEIAKNPSRDDVHEQREPQQSQEGVVATHKEASEP